MESKSVCLQAPGFHTMDDDVEIIVPDNLDDPDIEGIFPNFSQVQIQVHGSDVAEKILGDHPEELEVFGTEEYIDTEIDDDVQIISDNSPEHIQEPETITEEYKENIQEDNNITESDNYLEEDLDDIERIPDKDISKYDAVIEEYPDYANVLIKEEHESFVGTDYTDFEPGPIKEHDSDDLPPEDIYHCNNVIILGSKPCHSTSTSILKRLLYEKDSEEENEIKKENLNAVVLLEDWGANLERSNSFCEECGTLFVTPNDLDAHKMIAHSFLVPVSKNVAIKSTTKPAFARHSSGAIVVKGNKNIARKSTGSKVLGSMFCNHCNKVFPDNTTLIKHLYELLTLKQITCNICNAVFKTQKELSDHSIIHVKCEKVKKEKTVRKGAVVKKELKTVKKIRPMSPKVDVEVIPKSVLFQCPKCSLHFVTAFTGFQHYMYCESSTKKKISTCDTCKRKIHPKDMNIHKKQHDLCTKFRVFQVIRNLSEKTVCKCPNCELHFSDYGINLHLKECGNILSALCQKCNILLPKTRIRMHMKMHTEQNLKPKDFVNIQCVILRRAVKRKLEPPVTHAKKIKLGHHESNTNKNQQKVKIYRESSPDELVENKPIQNLNGYSNIAHTFRMYFCANCKRTSCSKRHRICHANKQCITKSYKESQVICPECGLLFNRDDMKYHKVLHKKNFNILKVAFYDIHTLKETLPLIPDYPQCEDCKINFFDVRVQAEHICGEDYETCNICSEKYHNSAYNAHIDFHKRINSEQTTLKMEPKIIPELMKKYKSLNMMWNIVYCCKKCDIITDQYDKAVEHSQGHLNHEPLTKNIKCYICNLKFDETCWSKHSELHSRMNINSKDFKILSYNPRKLLSEEWFELFHSLPKDLIKQVTDKSAYGTERRFKMKLLKEGRPEFTIYCCSDCRVGCRDNEIEKHMNSTCRNSSNVCIFCSISFSDISTLKNHQILHIKGIKKEEFRVVVFMKQQTKNKTKQVTKSKPNLQPIRLKITKHKQKKRPTLLTKKKKKGSIKTSKMQINPARGLQLDASGKYILYKCKNCKICIHVRGNIQAHKCNLDVKKCQYCNQFIRRVYLRIHEQRHINQPDFNIKNFKFSLFDPPNMIENEIEPAKSKTTSKNKKPASKTNKSVKAYTAKVAKIVKTKADTSNSADKTAMVYKCDCGLHYTSLKTIEKHAQTCASDTEISKEHCSKCGLLFPTDVLVSHLCKHHSKNSKFSVELYQKEPNNVESTSQSPVPRKKTDYQVIIYKCNECSVYFVNQNTCYRHVYKNHQPIDQRQCIDCKLCGLQFTINTLPIHVSRHHTGEFSLENVLVEEYYPPIGKGPPKREHYVAADKVQSFQVTSSIEEGRLSDN